MRDDQQRPQVEDFLIPWAASALKRLMEDRDLCDDASMLLMLGCQNNGVQRIAQLSQEGVHLTLLGTLVESFAFASQLQKS